MCASGDGYVHRSGRQNIAANEHRMGDVEYGSRVPNSPEASVGIRYENEDKDQKNNKTLFIIPGYLNTHPTCTTGTLAKRHGYFCTPPNTLPAHRHQIHHLQATN
jgi:hypothetical protein